MFFFSANIENHEGRGSSCVMEKILLQWVLFIIEMYILKSGTGVENKFLKIKSCLMVHKYIKIYN